MEISKIAVIHTDFPTKFGLPKQSGVVSDLRGTIVFEKEYRNPDALRGLEGFTHIWLIWEFSDGFSSKSAKNKRWAPTVRPPKLGGNRKIGVFATRSPNRPNPIGLSAVKIESIEETENFGTVIHVSGIDMKNGTPLFDIKPYLPSADLIHQAKGGFSDAIPYKKLKVEIPQDIASAVSHEILTTLSAILSEDPRPSYQSIDTSRIYGFSFANYEIRFTVCNDTLTVCEIEKQAINWLHEADFQSN